MADFMLDMCIKQGYVPKDCTLDGRVVMGLVNRSENPCDGCTENRSVCGGRPEEADYVAKRMAERELDMVQKKAHT